ncbi:MAG TPA: HAD-IIIA family hydrolase [Chitinophagaceae bacterium]|nr:HAD-IIIA family hydrolase [Chitinophagaceae bacterium]
MKTREAIILAGGLGTRLRDAVPGLPKCMAPVAGRPFLFYVINYLRSQGLERFVFSLGYKHEIIEQWLAQQFATLDYQCVIEEEPLGTGGAILLACSEVKGENVVVANGDTLFKLDISRLLSVHLEKDAACTLALKPMKDFDRYGVVELNENGAIKNFKEKQFYSSGLINGGIYALNVSKFQSENPPTKFSFEKDYLEKLFPTRKFFGVIDEGYFIDIGIPADYARAQVELQPAALDIGAIDKTWTLFIDRDGVINHEKKEEYIRNWGEFRFYEGVREAMKTFSNKFGKVIVISNQRGVGRQLMTEEDLSDIHRNMQDAIEKGGGRIDHIYYCTSPDNKNICRKPNPGMAFLAKKDFPGTDFSRSIMVGNKPSDMLFGRFAGIYTVFVKTTNPDQAFPHPDIDLAFESLADFAKAL